VGFYLFTCDFVFILNVCLLYLAMAIY